MYDLDYPAVEELLAAWGEPRAHARQVWRALYRDWVTGCDQMTALPQTLRARLTAETALYVPPVLVQQEAPDGETRKDLLQLEDGEQIEVVLLRYLERRSACISTQVGCACGCLFCATGQMGFVRQLSSGEIVSQVLHLQRDLATRRRRLTNVVLMGMGEPLLNYEHTLTAMRRLVDPHGLGFTPRRITLSTVGIVPGIERLAGENLQINLAVSLHAATDELRNQLVPINRRYPLDELFAAVQQYTAQTRRRVMFEWVMIDGVNDTREQAELLAPRLAACVAQNRSELPVHVNVIRLNPTPGYGGRSFSEEAMEAFTAVLDRAHIPHTVRQRRGGAIEAGCGQLRRPRNDAEMKSRRSVRSKTICSTHQTVSSSPL